MSINPRLRGMVKDLGKKRIKVVSISERMTEVTLVGVFVDDEYRGKGYVHNEVLKDLGLTRIIGKKRTKYLRQHGLMMNKFKTAFREPKRRMRTT